MLATAGALQIQLIGRFAMADPGGASVALKGRRARGLFAYLQFQQNQTETRGKLCNLFWGDRGETQARASLRQCLSELRASLPEAFRYCIVAEREFVRLDSSAVATDVSEIRKAVAEGSPETLCRLVQRAATARLLEDLELPGPFAEWLDLTRTQFDRNLGHGVYTLLKACEAQRDWSGTRDLAEAYFLRDPVDEIVAASLMRAEVALGYVSSARRRLKDLREALHKTFGVEPGMGTLAALKILPDVAEVAPSRDGRDKFRRTSPERGPPSVVVADLDSSNLTEEDRSLAGIVKMEVVGGLSGFRDFRVTATSATLSECDSEAWLQRGAGYLLGGNIWRSTHGIRLTAQLVRTSDQQVIWSERVEVSYAKMTEAVDRIIAKIIGAVSPVIDADLQRGATTWLDDQYRRYVAARGAAAAPASFEKAQHAVAELEALIAEDPAFILPYLPLARLYNTDFAYTRPLSSTAAERARAFSLAKNALSRDRGHIYAYTVVGWCHLRQGQWSAARTHFEQALVLNPFHADRMMDIGYGYLFLGEIERAEELLQRCLMLNPTPKDDYYIDLSLLEIIRNDYERSSIYQDLVAHPTTWSLLYRAMNADLSGRADPDLTQAFMDRARALWDPLVPFTAETVLRWVASDHPLAPPALREHFLAGVRHTLF